jgi:hypothetical protein
MKKLFFLTIIMIIIGQQQAKAQDIKVYENPTTEETYWIVENNTSPTIKVRWNPQISETEKQLIMNAGLFVGKLNPLMQLRSMGS